MYEDGNYTELEKENRLQLNNHPIHMSLESSVQDVIWPTITNPPASTQLAMQFQLQQSQWFNPEELRHNQLQQLNALWHYSYVNVPYYQRYLDNLEFNKSDLLTWENWRKIPILTRANIQQNQDKILSPNIPPQHGKPYKSFTSGSSGKPLTTWGTDVTAFFWRTFTLREHLWHNRNFKGKLAAIRCIDDDSAQSPHGLYLAGWGASTDIVLKTGPACVLDIKTHIAQQADWLIRENPHYLLTYPTNAMALAAHFKKTGKTLPNLQEIRTFGETVTKEMKSLCTEVWSLPITDMYSTHEVGHIALQCPEENNYHIQSENVLVEILHEDGTLCIPGEIGKVVITSLNNYASPLLRYEIGDYAQVGEPCPCGRGLPVLEKIMGRVQNMLTFPSGEQNWPDLNYKALLNIVPFKQIQICQHSLEGINIKLVVNQHVSKISEKQMIQVIHLDLGYPFHITFTYVDTISRTKGGKYEEFISRV